jgi:hypothetical protein
MPLLSANRGSVPTALSAAGPLATLGVQTTRYQHQVFVEVDDHV